MAAGRDAIASRSIKATASPVRLTFGALQQIRISALFPPSGDAIRTASAALHFGLAHGDVRNSSTCHT